MGQEPNDQYAVLKGSLDSSAAVPSKNAKHSYTRDFLLSFAELDNCNNQPSGLDPQILRNHVVEGVNTAPSSSTRGLIRRDSDGSGEALQNIPEWRRAPGNPGGVMLTQGSKRSDQGGTSFTDNFSSRTGPNWGENSHSWSNYDRSGRQGSGNQGRWEHRPGGNDKERDRPRHDRDVLEQDSGRRLHGSDHLTRHGMPSEHDGLLGSGAGPRSSRSSGGSIIPNTRGHDRHHSGRTNQANDAYQPLRSSKVGTHSRSEMTDFYNDETFGTDEISNQEKIEQERRRRDSFELLRKEQQKVLQEKQKLNAQKQVEHHACQSGNTSNMKYDEQFLLEDVEKLEDHSAILPLPDESRSSASAKTTLPVVSMPTAPRPLVPPGFSKILLEKSISVKAANKVASEVVNTEMAKVCSDATKANTPLDGKGNQMKEGQLNKSAMSTNKQEPQASGQDTFGMSAVAEDDKGQLQVSGNVDCYQATGSLGVASNLMKADRTVSLPESEHDVWSPGLDNIPDSKRAREDEARTNVSKETPERILDRLFGKASADFDKQDVSIPDESEVINGDSTRVPKSSKFARWFHTEEEIPSDDISIRDASDILSLLSKSEKAVLPTTLSEERTSVHDVPNSPLSSIFPLRNPVRVLPMPAGPSLEDVEKVMTATVKANVRDETGRFHVPGNQKEDSLDLPFNTDVADSLNKKDHQYSNSSRLPGMVLTCEDLEQSIIAEASESVSKLQIHSDERHTDSDGNVLANGKKLQMDDHASQHLLSLLQKGDQKSSMNPDHREKYVAPMGADQHEDTINAEKVGYPEKIGGAQTLEFLFGKAFMKELRSADAPVSVKPPVPGKTFSNDVSLGGNVVESSFTVSLNPQKSLPNAEFETDIDKPDVCSSSMKMNTKDGKRVGLQSQQLSLDGNTYRSDQDLWPNSSNLNIEIQNSIGNSQFENTKGMGTGNFALLGTGAKAMPNAMDNGEYSDSLISDFGSNLEKEGNSSLKGGFESGSKKPMFDAGNMAVGHSFTGQNDSISGKLTSDGRSTFLRRSPSNGNSAPLPVFDEFLTTRLTGSQMPDKFIGLDVQRSMPENVQKSMAFKDEKSRYEDHNTSMLDAAMQHYRAADVRVLESRTSMNGLVGTSFPPFANTTYQSGVVEPTNLPNSSGIQQLLGLLPPQTSHSSQQQLLGPTDLPFNSHSLPGPQGRPPPPFFSYPHGPGPYDLNLGGISSIPNQQMNHQQTPQSRQLKLFDHGNSLDPQHSGSDIWSDHLHGRPFPQEPSGQMLYPLHGGPPMNQPVYHSLRPHGFPPNHLIQPVPVPQRGLSSMNNFPFIPEQLPHGPRGLPSNYPHVPGPFMPEISMHSMQSPPFHLQPSHTSVGTPHNQLRPLFGASPDINVPVEARRHMGAMGNEGAVLDMLFAKELKRQPSGSVPANQYPGRNMGYG